MFEISAVPTPHIRAIRLQLRLHKQNCFPDDNVKATRSNDSDKRLFVAVHQPVYVLSGAAAGVHSVRTVHVGAVARPSERLPHRPPSGSARHHEYLRPRRSKQFDRKVNAG